MDARYYAPRIVFARQVGTNYHYRARETTHHPHGKVTHHKVPGSERTVTSAYGSTYTERDWYDVYHPPYTTTSRMVILDPEIPTGEKPNSLYLLCYVYGAESVNKIYKHVMDGDPYYFKPYYHGVTSLAHVHYDRGNRFYKSFKAAQRNCSGTQIVVRYILS